MSRTLTAAALAAFLAFPARPAGAVDLAVTIDGIRNDHGRVYATLYGDPEKWLDADRSLQDLSIPARPGAVVITFHNVAPGRYAVVTYHDENGNNLLDFNFFGLPIEGYAFSRGARPLLSAPSFERCAFDVGRDSAEIMIHMVYP